MSDKPLTATEVQIANDEFYGSQEYLKFELAMLKVKNELLRPVIDATMKTLKEQDEH